MTTKPQLGRSVQEGDFNSPDSVLWYTPKLSPPVLGLRCSRFTNPKQIIAYP
jgi:hypothetical protein